MSIHDWMKKNCYSKNYSHFDSRVNLSDVWKYISDHKNISKHGFYPFISHTLIYNKYNPKKGLIKKERKIMYSAHIDRYIYSYYGFLLNEKYNIYARNNNINESVIAYRDNLNKNNIDFAKKAFDSIKINNSSFIILGDFTKFFDNIDHLYLKQMICSLLECDRLPADYYAVYKNITRFSEWPLEDLLTFNGLQNDKNSIRKLNKKNTVINKNDFKAMKKKSLIQNMNQYGIPQGSPISAILSNIFMMDFDVNVKKLVDSYNGTYLRYCDDFIVIIPNNCIDISLVYNRFLDILSHIPRLALQPEKTLLYEYFDEVIVGSDPTSFLLEKRTLKELDYLGFTFDGKYVRLRDKTVSKYYYRMYRKIKSYTKYGGYTKHGNRIPKKHLYEKYSIKGAQNSRGNFISYVIRSNEVFNDEIRIKKLLHRHMKKIKKRIQKQN